MYEYEDKATSTLISRKRREGIDKQLNEIFEDIIDNVIKLDMSKLFHKPVKKKEYPDYYNIVEKPIDLGEIKNRTKRNEYKNREQFLEDLRLMAKNSVLYNGETHEVTKNVYKILETVEKKLEICKETVEKYENKIANLTIFG